MTDRKLLDDEGENQAVRCFLMAYGAQSMTLDKMMTHMKACGYPLWPEWVETTEMRGHLTKAGAQLWLRHLFALEAVEMGRMK